MNEQDFPRYKVTFIFLTAIVALLEVLGAIDLGNRPYSGFLADDEQSITSVLPDSPAQRAGIQVGDQMKTNAGVDVKNVKALLRLPRANIGETRTYTFDRSGTMITIDLTFEALPPKEIVLSVAFAILGFCFLSLGLWAFFKVANTCTTLLALFCFSAAIDFITHPYVASYDLRLVYMSVLNIIVFFGYAFLFHLLLTFPIPKQIMAKKYSMILIYGPATLMSVVLILFAILQPERSGWLFVLATVLYGLFFIGYLGMAVSALIHSYAKATKEERIVSGLRLMLFGTMIGLAPSIISGIVRFLAPTLVLPAVDYYIFPAVLIPFSLALATTKARRVS